MKMPDRCGISASGGVPPALPNNQSKMADRDEPCEARGNQVTASLKSQHRCEIQAPGTGSCLLPVRRSQNQLRDAHGPPRSHSGIHVQRQAHHSPCEEETRNRIESFPRVPGLGRCRPGESMPEIDAGTYFCWKAYS